MANGSCGCEIPATKKYQDNNTCSECREVFCAEHLYIYVDGNNISITRNSRPHCEDCYKLKYK
jgi:hypothetical protein